MSRLSASSVRKAGSISRRALSSAVFLPSAFLSSVEGDSDPRRGFFRSTPAFLTDDADSLDIGVCLLEPQSFGAFSLDMLEWCAEFLLLRKRVWRLALDDSPEARKMATAATLFASHDIDKNSSNVNKIIPGKTMASKLTILNTP